MRKRIFTLLISLFAMIYQPFFNLCNPTSLSYGDILNYTRFKITIDQALFNQWGFKYPVTYIFNLPASSSGLAVYKSDNGTDPWTLLPEKTSADFFNGIEVVRFDYFNNKAYVSLGFDTNNAIYLKFTNTTGVTFDSIANYYDDRKATYTLSTDDWGNDVWEPQTIGVPCNGDMEEKDCDNNQAAILAARYFNLYVSIGIISEAPLNDPVANSTKWDRMQEEIDVGDNRWEPATHTRSHPCSSSAYAGSSFGGYNGEIIGCTQDILSKLVSIPFGQYVFEFILPCGFEDSTLKSTAAGNFLFLRGYDTDDHPENINYEPWNETYSYYGPGGIQTVSYDSVFLARTPWGRYYASDVAKLNDAFDAAYNSSGIFYALYHGDWYSNNVIYSLDDPVDGVSGSTLIQHWNHVANRNDVWYVANGWLYSYKMVADRANVFNFDIAGTVRDKIYQQPLDNVTINLYLIQSCGDDVLKDVTTTGSGGVPGQYVFKNVDEGYYRIKPVMSGYTFEPEDFTIDVPGENMQLDFEATENSPCGG